MSLACNQNQNTNSLPHHDKPEPIIRTVHTAFQTSFPTKLPIESCYGGLDLEHLLYMALLCYCSTVLCPKSKGMQIFWSIREELTSALPHSAPKHSDAEDDCLFWIWTVAVLSWTAEGPTRLTMKGIELAEQQRRRWSWTYSTAERKKALRLLQQFFWNDNLSRSARDLLLGKV